MKVVVTGGSGFLGSALVNRLSTEHEMVVLDNGSRNSGQLKQDPSITCHRCDVTKDPLLYHVKGADTLIHMAAINGTKNFYERPLDVLHVQVTGTMRVLKAAIHARVKTFVLFSSSEVYQSPMHFPTPEDSPLLIPDITNHRLSYAVSKMCSEAMVEAARSQFTRTIIVRPHNVYGPHMGTDHVIPALLTKLHTTQEHEPLEVRGLKDSTRTYMYVDDFVEAMVSVLRRSQSGIINIGNDKKHETSLMRLVHVMMGVVNEERPIMWLQAPVGSPFRRVPDVSKLMGLGYDPEKAVPLRVGIGKVWESMGGQTCQG